MSSAIQVVLAGIYGCTLVKPSTTTMIAWKHSDSVDSLLEFIAICSKEPSPVTIGTNFVCLLCLSAWLFWHLMYSATYLATPSVHLSYVKFHEIRSWFRCPPRCPTPWLSGCWLSTSKWYSYSTTKSPLFFSCMPSSMASNFISSTSSVFTMLLFSSFNKCTSSKHYSSIPYFSFPKSLDRPCGLHVWNPDPQWI